MKNDPQITALLAEAWREYRRKEFAADLEQVAKLLRDGTPEQLAEFTSLQRRRPRGQSRRASRWLDARRCHQEARQARKSRRTRSCCNTRETVCSSVHAESYPSGLVVLRRLRETKATPVAVVPELSGEGCSNSGRGYPSYPGDGCSDERCWRVFALWRPSPCSAGAPVGCRARFNRWGW